MLEKNEAVRRELGVLGIFWNKNVDNFTRMFCRTRFRLIIFGGVLTFRYRQNSFLWIPIQTTICGSEHHILLRQLK